MRYCPASTLQVFNGMPTILHSLFASFIQVSALPVVYKLLTAEDKSAQQAAIQMLTFLCQMDSEWQAKEQIALASYDNGIILTVLVERLEATANLNKLSAAKAAELATLLQLLSSATSGIQERDLTPYS